MGKILTAKQLFKLKDECLKERYGNAVSPLEFYRDFFPEGTLEERGDFEGGKPNIIATSGFKKSKEEIARIVEKEKKEEAEYLEKRKLGIPVDKPKRYKRRWARNTIIFDDLEGLEELLNNDDELLDFVIIPAVAFSGKNRTLQNAYHLWGFIIDLDGVEMDQLEDLIHQIENDVIPEPTYIVNSGHGMHLYYMLEDYVPMYPRLQKQLQELKKALTDVVWNVYTSTIPVEKRQYQSIVQGYRAVGSPSKLGRRYRVSAYRVGRKRTLTYLMDWATTERGIDFDEFKHVTLDEAKEKWPEWYQWKVVEGQKRKPFYFPRAVYDSWKKRMEQGAFDGNRYNCISIMFSLAIRCQIDFDEVLSDAMELVPRLNRLTRKKSNEFTTDDVLDASSYYDEAFFNLGLKKVYRMTKIYIEPAKRNKKNQKEHLEEARAIRDVRMKRQNRDWRNNDGAPTKQEIISEWRKNNPEGRKIDCERETGLSRHTVLKWWDGTQKEKPEALKDVFMPISKEVQNNQKVKQDLLKAFMEMDEKELEKFIEMLEK